MPFSQKKSWRKKILSADKIWNQVRGMLKSRGLDLPEAARRPDIRLILDNRSGMDRIRELADRRTGDTADCSVGCQGVLWRAF